MKHTSFTESELDEALRSLKMAATDEAFEQLTRERKRPRMTYRLWYTAAAVAAIVIIAIWPKRNDVQEQAPTETTTMVDEDLSQLVSQSIAEQAKTQQQRSLTDNIVSEHISLVEP